jgi:hypothetical protein
MHTENKGTTAPHSQCALLLCVYGTNFKASQKQVLQHSIFCSDRINRSGNSQQMPTRSTSGSGRSSLTLAIDVLPFPIRKARYRFVSATDRSPSGRELEEFRELNQYSDSATLLDYRGI